MPCVPHQHASSAPVPASAELCPAACPRSHRATPAPRFAHQSVGCPRPGQLAPRLNTRADVRQKRLILSRLHRARARPCRSRVPPGRPSRAYPELPRLPAPVLFGCRASSPSMFPSPLKAGSVPLLFRAQNPAGAAPTAVELTLHVASHHCSSSGVTTTTIGFPSTRRCSPATTPSPSASEQRWRHSPKTPSHHHSRHHRSRPPPTPRVGPVDSG